MLCSDERRARCIIDVNRGGHWLTMDNQEGPTGTGFKDEELLRSCEFKTIIAGNTCSKIIDHEAMAKATFFTLALNNII